MKMYWDLYFENYSNEELIRENYNPLRDFESELIEGTIIDIGCGQSAFILDFLCLEKNLIGVDSELFQLEYLKKRIEKYSSEKLKSCQFINATFPQENLPDIDYSAIILSNLLHFFDLETNIEIGKILANKAKSGTIIYIQVHSHKHYANKPEDPDNNIYFKHFFNESDLKLIFNNILFDRIYFADIESIDSKKSVTFLEKWLDKNLDKNKVFDPIRRLAVKKDYLINKSDSYYVAMFRKK